MNMNKEHAMYQLERYGGLALSDIRGRVVTCVSGSVWMTMEGDLRDVVLAPGNSFVVDRDGMTLHAAQAPSVVEVVAQNEPRTWRDRIAEYLDKTWGPGAIRPSRTRYY